jgi:NAD(P)-dependent dehydrogenase (short-subunit alcohol dehydrogenase family)
MNVSSTTGDLSGRIALLTGASRGIGAAVARAYAKAGAHVILLARTVGALEALDDEIRGFGGTATLLPQDLRQHDKLDTLGPVIAERFGRLDILVGNAGMLGTLTPLPHMNAKEWQDVFDINVHANFRLIRTLDPLLRASDAGRAVFVTSGMAHKNTAYWGAYCASKAALDIMVKVYAAEVAHTALRVNLLSPGVVDTKMLKSAYPGGYQAGPVKQPEDLAPLFLDLADAACTRHGEVIAADALKAECYRILKSA